MKYSEFRKINLSNVSIFINDFWIINEVFIKSKNKNSNFLFVFYEGPPSTNGLPGIHHMLSRTIKDVFCRYKTLKGYLVERKAGWDSHGLPIELNIEKYLKVNKEDIGNKITIKDYNNECYKSIMHYKFRWELLTNKMGYWIDMNNSYITFNSLFIESVWYIVKKLSKKKMLYKGYSIQPYSPAAGTSLSYHEINQPGCYKLVKDTSIIAQFKLKNSNFDYFLAWTTTLWTLPSNVALALNPDIEYLKVNTINKYTRTSINVIFSKNSLNKYFYDNIYKYISFKVIKIFKGLDLLGLKYCQLLPYIKSKSNNSFTVISGGFVDTNEGTGIVHISPSFGEDDRILSEKNKILPITVLNEKNKSIPVVNKEGKFINNIFDFSGRYVKDLYENSFSFKENNYKPIDLLIFNKLEKKNKVFLIEEYSHNYPHCWRTKKPILYYPLDSWFIKTTFFKDLFIKLNNEINWIPNNIKDGRFGNWLKNLVDWNLSRDRFWGTPLPVWRTFDNKEEKCIGSIKELILEIDKSILFGFMKNKLDIKFDLHKPYIDNIILVSNTNAKMQRENSLIDVWFDAGSMPYAQWNYPFENIEIFKNNYPADFISEGLDQTRGWFFTLHAISVIIFNNISFKNVFVNGLILDNNGVKMSKNLNNSVDPFYVIDKYGPDSIRWYMVNNSNAAENIKFNVVNIESIIKKFFSTIQNIYNFFSLYANIDNFTFFKKTMNFNLSIDLWIISKLNRLIKISEYYYNNYNINKVSKLIEDFLLYDFSNWYIRINRKRFWKSNLNKEYIYHILYTSLISLIKLSSPISPFYMDMLYMNITRNKKSVHLSKFPIYNFNCLNMSLEKKMNFVKIIISLVHSLRKKHGLRVRQILSEVLLIDFNRDLKFNLLDFHKVILSEINVKKIKYVKSSSLVLSKKIKFNFRNSGKIYGIYVKEFLLIFKKISFNFVNFFEKNYYFLFRLKNKFIKISLANILIYSKYIDKFSIISKNSITIGLNINISLLLKKHGFIRDFISKIQNIRKKMMLSVQSKIKILISLDNSFLCNFIIKNSLYICNEVQSERLELTNEILKNVDFISFNNTILNFEIKLSKF